MRVALVTHQFFPSFYTGVERLALNLAGQLRRMGHDAVVVAPAATSSGDAAPYVWEGTPVRPVEVPRAELADPWRDGPARAVRIAEALREEGSELVHVLQPMRLPQATEAAAQLGLPVVAHVSDFVYPCARVTLLRADGSPCPDAEEGRACRSACAIPTGPDRFAWGRDTLAAAAVVVSPCRATIATHAAFGFDTAGWRHIPWGVDYALHPERLPAPAGGPLRIGFLGTLLRHKGPHVLVEAVRLLAGRDVELVLYGGSFHEPGYERELRRLAGGDPRIRFAGAYDHATLPQVLAPLDLVAIPSLWPENLPTVGLNAVAAGVPLLVSDVPGLTELLDDYRCGHAFAAGDPASAATVLASLLDDRDGLADLRRTMAFPPGLEEEAWALEALYAELRS